MWNSLPRTCSCTWGNWRSIVRSSSSRGPSRVTICTSDGIVTVCWGTCGWLWVEPGVVAGSWVWASLIVGPVYGPGRRGTTRKTGRSARGPGEIAAAEHVQVGVEDALLGRGAGVGDEPEARQSLVVGDPPREGDGVGELLG